MEARNTTDEIDLLEILARLYSNLKNNLLLSIILPLTGLIAGFMFAYTSESKVESSMMVVTRLLSLAECQFLLKQMEKSDTFYAITPEQRSGLISISHEIALDPTPVVDKDNPRVHITISLTVRNHDLLRPFQNSIITYLEASRPAVKKKYEQHEMYAGLIAEIDRELKGLDEVKTQITTRAQASFLNPAALYTAPVELTKQKIQYQLGLSDNTAFNLVQGFDAMSRIAKLSPVVYALIGVLAGVAVLFMLLFLKYFWSYYRKYRQLHQP